MAYNLQKRLRESAAAGATLCGGGVLGRRGVPVPGEQLVQAAGVVVGNAPQHVGEPGLRIEVVELGGLCRLPNYAERARFLQGLS